MLCTTASSSTLQNRATFFGFQLAGGCQIGYISQVYTQGVFTQFPLQLSDTFQIRQRLDIAYGSADFCNDEVEFIFVAQQFHVTFDFVRDVRDDLDGLTQVVLPR